MSLYPADASERMTFDGGVALLNPSGWGNLGDAAILESAIHAVRSRLPGAPVLALTLNPRDTAARHGVAAFTCSGFSRPYYGVTEHGPILVEDQPIQTDAPALPWRWRTGLRKRLAVPLAAWSMARAVPRELSHRRRLATATGHLRAIVVAGGGQIDDFWGGAFGHPYVLWRWAAHARATGANCAFLSVGTGSLETPAARQLAWRALGLANYRSFRDEGSRSLLGNARFDADPVVPDLAYGLPKAFTSAVEGPRPGRRMVAISPIAYGDPRVWPTPDAEKYRSYLERLGAVAAGLVREGAEVVLFGTDSPDLVTVTELRDEIERQAGVEALERVRVPQVRSLEQLFAALSGAHAVIASRLHGVILSQLAEVPVLALSYERKVLAHMQSLKEQNFTFKIDDFEPRATLARFEELLRGRESLVRSVGELFSERRARVEAQYDTVFGAAGSSVAALKATAGRV